MEEILKLINRKFISLKKKEVSRTNVLLHSTINILITYMREADYIFNLLYKGQYFGGSYYDKLKVEKPDEFDIDFVLGLPKCEKCKIKNCSCITVKPSDTTGYLWFELKENCCTPVYQKFVRNGHFQTNLVYNWMKSLLYKALDKLKKENDMMNKLAEENYMIQNTEVTFYTECAPALKICIKGESETILIDLAPAFQFDCSYWPVNGFKPNPSNKGCFSLVPMSPKDQPEYWRPSFQAQEKKLIARKERLKPALRLLKKMRSNLNHKISSYALKSLILEEVDNFEWENKSLSETFMIVLQKYINSLAAGFIPYFWNEKVNLLSYLNHETIKNHYNEIYKLYCKIKQEYQTNPIIIAEIILKKDSDDYKEFMAFWNQSKWQREVHTGFSSNNDEYFETNEDVPFLAHMLPRRLDRER